MRKLVEEIRPEWLIHELAAKTGEEMVERIRMQRKVLGFEG